jgi:lipoate-protein ligase B
MTSTRPLEVHRLGTASYDRGLAWQRAALEAVRAGDAERIALLQHEAVYTLGARASRAALRVEEAALPAPLVIASRGGDVTFHGPGQLVAYLVLDLRSRDLHAGDYVRALEGVLIETLAALGVEGERWPGRPGAWVRLEGAPAKVAAIGVRVERGISSHGLALNVSTDLRWFDPIVPCGIEDAGVTSLEQLSGAAPPLEAVERALLEACARTFEVELVETREPVHA